MSATLLLLAMLASPPDGAQLVAQNCNLCHTDSLLAQQRLTAQQWTNAVKKMNGWGAPLEADELAPAAAELVARTPTSSIAFVPERIKSAELAKRFEPQSDGKLAKGVASHGAELWAANCASCHGDAAQGAKTGPNLAGRLLLQRAADFAAAVRTASGRMPAFPFSDRELADLLAHLRSIR